MPLYEYRCKECGEKFEKLVSLSEAEGRLKPPLRVIDAFGSVG